MLFYLRTYIFQLADFNALACRLALGSCTANKYELPFVQSGPLLVTFVRHVCLISLLLLVLAFLSPEFFFAVFLSAIHFDTERCKCDMRT